jgi:hypothetical protein
MNRCYIYISLLLLAFLSQSYVVKDATFAVAGGDTRKEVLKKEGKLDISEIRIKNTSNQPIRIKWTRIENTLPDYWDYSMCAYGKCQVGIPSGSVFKSIKPGDEGFIAVHVFPKKRTGEGKVVFELSDIDNPNYLKRITFLVSVVE